MKPSAPPHFWHPAESEAGEEEGGMSDMMQTGFDYGALPVELAVKSRAAAERIKLRLKRTVEDIIEIGRELTAIKAELPHGQFLPWIAAEFEMTHGPPTSS